MKTRAILALTAAAGLAGVANAQTTTSSSSVTMTVFFGGEAPGGNGNGTIEPGESALIGIAVAWTGFNTVGSFSPAVSGATSGTIRGLGGGFVDLVGAGGVAGTWDMDPNTNGYGVQNPSFDPGVMGNAHANGVSNIQFAQLPSSVNAINTSQFPAGSPIWLGLWTPSDYSARNVSFGGQAAAAAGGLPFSVLFRILNQAGSPAVASAFVTSGNISFTGTGDIAIAPAPSSLALLGLGALVVGRRRR
jgi:hypothetical protein